MRNHRNLAFKMWLFKKFNIPLASSAGWIYFSAILSIFISISSCRSSKETYSPYRKYSPAQLQEDFRVYRETLEEAHPGLYWYTSKDSMDQYFEWGRAFLNDSLTEPQFRRILAYITARINCGHTAIRSSKNYLRYQDTARITRIFPLSLKIWNDTAVITTNLFRNDSILKRGVVVTSINERPLPAIIDTFFRFIGTDGYNQTHKFQTISNRGAFGSLYSTLFGFNTLYTIGYLDSAGNSKTTLLKYYAPPTDTSNRPPPVPLARAPEPTRKERRNIRRNSVRLLKIDTTNRTAMMDLNTFSRGFGLKSFFRRSFKTLRKNNIDRLIIDVRNNSGGSPNNSTLITKYLSDHRFKIGDSLYAITKHKKYGRYIKGDYWNRVFMTFFTAKKKDGNYHLGYFEKHSFKPKKKNHFDGQAYILISGNSFSATTLFARALIDQDNITVIGEETGGGAYGNTAWQIPTLTLPETKLRLNLPLYRLVINRNYPKTGRGIFPEVEVPPTIAGIKSRKDMVLEKALEIIANSRQPLDSNASK